MARALPIVGEGGLSRYLAEIRKFPLLDPQEEYMLAKRWREHQDTEAAHKLVTSHLRLVAKIAMGYRGYGLPIPIRRKNTCWPSAGVSIRTPRPRTSLSPAISDSWPRSRWAIAAMACRSRSAGRIHAGQALA